VGRVSQDAKATIPSGNYLVALGANLPGNAPSPADNLELALSLFPDAGLTPVRVSRWYQSPAWPAGSGPDYVNGAAAVRSRLGPEGVLAALHAVESRLGRIRRRRWEPRVCDLDLIAAGGAVLPDRATVLNWMSRDQQAARDAPDGLVLPHPRMHERAFVLVPLCDVAPGWVHPVLGRRAQTLLRGLDRRGIRPLG
jgi:2-amino-4-hydroxy-6-hydroxymethyldihydropteridine diphosphokinase